ncbi:transcription factor 21-like isoform X3 [Tachypleus tridentatus]|uniref:transcription factor 21-like isoform X3 n=1 Tax=Tachypleus tridentatus TaxID=6853 RepID=UPI003FCFD795
MCNKSDSSGLRTDNPRMARDRKGSVGNMGISKRNKPIQRNAANARERARMRVLSKAFSKLKTSLPWVPEDTKLSKLDTLRLASSYIAHLRQILTEDTGPHAVVHPITLPRLMISSVTYSKTAVSHHFPWQAFRCSSWSQSSLQDATTKLHLSDATRTNHLTPYTNRSRAALKKKR